MTWTRLDDQFHAHPKVLRAWEADRASIGLHLLALSHAGAYLTDGHVSEAFVCRCFSRASERRRAVAALVDAGLWELADSGWVIHDYLHFNASRASVRERRASRARERGRPGASAGDPTLNPHPFKRSHPSIGEARA